MLSHTNGTTAPATTLRQTPAPVAPAVRHFLHELRRLPLATWIRIAHEAQTAVQCEEDREAAREARAYLREVMNGFPGALHHARREVLDITEVASAFTTPAATAAMRRTALTAVLALVARDWLRRSEFALL